MSRALVVSNFPILARSVAHVIATRYDVSLQRWCVVEAGALLDMDLIVLDVTGVDFDRAHRLLAGIPPGIPTATCSLYENAIRVYRSTPHGPAIGAELPSLLALMEYGEPSIE